MASLRHTSSSKFKTASFDENRWLTQIRQTLQEELEDESEVLVSISSVPKTLMVIDPDSYTPQEVAIGPYHYWRSELYEMERYKLASAKRCQKHLPSGRTFDDLVQQLSKHEVRIRVSYHKFLNLGGETLAWMMAIDASFLLEFLQYYAIQEGKILTRVSSMMSRLHDRGERNKSMRNAILRDIIMLENQIPLFVLKIVLEFQYSSPKVADEILLAMLVGFCRDVSPFKMMADDHLRPDHIKVSECAHLLDFLYHMITHEAEGQPQHQIILEVPVESHSDRILQEEAKDQSESEEIHGSRTDDQEEAKEESKEVSFAKPDAVRQLLITICKMIMKVNRGPIRSLTKVLTSKPVQVIMKLPWKVISTVPGLKFLKIPILYLFYGQVKEKAESEDENSDSNAFKPPLIEEITIPSVTELSNSGVRFKATNGNISTVAFDVKKVTIYLPTVGLEINTEVIMRNLVAYEASNASGPLVFTRYTELMNGIIDSEEDVKLLRKRGIILNRLKSDEEVANLLNGMSKSIRLTKVPFLDKVIEDVNKFYNGRWMVKVGKFMKHYVFGSWRFLSLLAAMLMLLMTALQAFCTVYSCPDFFNIDTD